MDPIDLRPLLDRVPGAAVYAFGSRAGGVARAESDLAVLPPRPLDPVERLGA